MGTQQILLIVLSVIIVGVAIAVGIQMFNAQSYNSNKTAIAADAQTYATQVVQYYKTPKSQGGGGNELPTDATEIGDAIGFEEDGTIENDNGIYTLGFGTVANTVTITGVGKSEKTGAKHPKHPNILTTIAFPAGTITAVASDEEVSGT